MKLLKNMLIYLAWLVKNIYFLIAFLICLSIIYLSKNYFHPNFSKGYLIGKEAVFPYFKYFLYLHILTAPIVYISGLFQFMFTRNKGHKLVGKIYIFSVLCLAAPSGFLMSFFSIGGFWAILNFILLSVLWFLVTYKSYLAILVSDYKIHKQFIIRSFILTNSAILLRLFSYFNNNYHLLKPSNSYVIIAWFSWLPWLILYELYLLGNKNANNSV